MATRRRNAGGVFLVVLLLLGALVAVGLYLGDGYALTRTERETASQLQRQLGTPAPPSVEIEGRPFLSQVVARHLRTVHVVADGVATTPTGGSGSTVPVQHADIVLSDVTTSDWFQTMTARRVEGTALLVYADLAGVSSVPLTYAGDGRLRFEQTTSFLGAEVRVQVTGTPRLDIEAQTISLADPKLTLGSVDVPGAVAATLLRTLVKPIPIEGLPFGLPLSSVSAEEDGLHADLQGDNVKFNR